MDTAVKTLMKEQTKKAKKLDKKIRSLAWERTKVYESRYVSAGCLQLLKFLRAVGFDYDRVAKRLTPLEMCRCWAHALFFAYLNPLSGPPADHFLWRRQRVKEAAYTILGKRRLERRMKTRALLSQVVIDLSRPRSFCPRFRGSLRPEDDDILASVSLEEANLCAITDDWDVLHEAVDFFGTLARKTTYAEYNRPRVLLAGWRLMARKDAYRGQ